ncbi:MAG: hypothetical protein AAGC46_05090 [Solirubrobacteraceae bacterium]|nr:hypothetical protein [Patulibacter sp.]
MRHFLLAVTLFAAVAVGVGGVVAAAGPSAPKTVKACVDAAGALRLQGKKACPKKTTALTIGTAGVTGPPGVRGADGAAGAAGLRGADGVAGPTGAVGATGAAGAVGTTGPTGATGAKGTPDPSLFYTKTEADARYAQGGNQFTIPGIDFTPLVSTAGINRGNYFGIYETGTRQYAGASLGGVPSGATVTSVDFFITHASGSQTELDLSDVNPAAGTSSTKVINQYTATSAAIQKVTLTPTFGYAPAVGHAGMLYWNPANQSTDDILWGATVHYTLD